MAATATPTTTATTATTKNCVKRILLVDDEARLRGIIARYLRARGHVVVEAETAQAASATLAEEAFDILLLDINLPDDTGWAVLRRLEGMSAGTTQPLVVILSAVPPSPRRIAQFAPDAVLNKPFPIDALSRLVESDCELVEVEAVLEEAARGPVQGEGHMGHGG